MAKEKEQTSLLPWAFPQPFCMIWAKSLLSLWFPSCLFVWLTVSFGADLMYSSQGMGKAQLVQGCP